MSADGGLRKIFSEHLRKPAWEWSPIESRGTVSGIPDTFWSHESGAHGWIEMKATDGWAVDLRPHQVGWLHRHAARGVRCTVVVLARGAGSAAGQGTALYAVRGVAAGKLAAQGLPRCPGDDPDVLGVWYGPPRSWDWAAVAACLMR